METRRMKRFSITGEELFNLLQGRVRIVEGIPLSAHYCGAAHDVASNVVCVYVEHPEFESVSAGRMLPHGEIVVEAISPQKTGTNG